MIGMMVVVKFVGSREEWETERELGFTILGPDAEVVKDEETIKMKALLGQPLFEVYERGGIVVTAHQFEVQSSGAYSLEIAVDGDNKKSVPFYIHEGPPPPAPEPEA